MSYPDINLTGEEIHNAFCIVAPDEACPWDEITLVAQQHYDAVAQELSRELNARLAWFEDKSTISAVKCPKCGHMLTNLKNHPCLEPRKGHNHD